MEGAYMEGWLYLIDNLSKNILWNFGEQYLHTKEDSYGPTAILL